jgi:predicted phosphodiesterase
MMMTGAERRPANPGRPPAAHPIRGAVLALVVATAGCSTPAVVHLETTNAVVRHHEAGQASLWAFAPDLSVDLVWEHGPGTFLLYLENIAADAVEVKISGSGEQPRYRLRTLSPTRLEVRLRGDRSYRLEVTRPFTAPPVVGLVGDSQGREEVLNRIVEDMNRTGIDFVIHLGDMVPSGMADEYVRFLATMAALNVPFYTVPGNHDVRGRGADRYRALFGPMQHSFTAGRYRFILADTSDLGTDSHRLEWLREQLAGQVPSLLFMHAPPRDPRGLEHRMVDDRHAGEMLHLLWAHPPLAVATGHIHMFHRVEEQGTHWITSGGGGGNLYASPGAGGFHHWTRISLEGERVEVHYREIEAPAPPLGLVVSGPGGDVEFTPEQLLGMEQLSGQSAFENQRGTISPGGTFRGIAVATLLEMAGGMQPDDILIVESSDGYQQLFSYHNVYPRTIGWDHLQGEMLLALSLDGVAPPAWTRGYQTVFLPPGGVYTNAICMETSAPGQGCRVYASAGARWVRNVHRLEVRR